MAHESQKERQKVLDSLEKWRKSSLCERCTILDRTYELFKQIGKVTGREHEANELVDETKHNVEKVIKVGAKTS